MTNVSLHDFRLNVDRYLAAVATGDVAVTQDGEPWIVLRAAEDDLDRPPVLRQFVNRFNLVIL